MSEKYYVITYDADGDPADISEYTEEELEKKLSDEYWGPRPKVLRTARDFDPGTFAGIVIIKGRLVVPKRKHVGRTALNDGFPAG